MKLAGFDKTDVLAGRVSRAAGEQTTEFSKVPVAVTFVPDHVALDFVGRRHTPQLRATGYLGRVVPKEPLPYDIRELTFGAENPHEVTLDYSFTTEQLTDLVSKGLYLEGFTVPADMTELEWEIPVEMDVTVVGPGRTDGPPVVMLDLSSVARIDTDMEKTGYDLSAMFEDYRAFVREHGSEKETSVAPSMVREDEYGDMFEREAEVEHDRVTSINQPTHHREQPESVLEQLGGEYRGLDLVAELRAAGEADTRSAEEILADAENEDRYSGLDPVARRNAEHYDRIMAAHRAQEEAEGVSARRLGERLSQTEREGAQHDVDNDLDLSAFEGVDFDDLDLDVQTPDASTDASVDETVDETIATPEASPAAASAAPGDGDLFADEDEQDAPVEEAPEATDYTHEDEAVVGGRGGVEHDPRVARDRQNRIARAAREAQTRQSQREGSVPVDKRVDVGTIGKDVAAKKEPEKDTGLDI